MQVTTPSDHEIALTREFDAPRETPFAALTQPEHLRARMKPSHVALVSCEVDMRAGGRLRYVFERPNGRTIEVRGLYDSLNPPRHWTYTETCDFSPLTMRVATTLDDVNGTTTYRQTLRYTSKQERDEDFNGVASSAPGDPRQAGALPGGDPEMTTRLSDRRDAAPRAAPHPVTLRP